MQRLIGLFALPMLLVGLSACSYLFYPRAGDYATQAKGASGRCGSDLACFDQTIKSTSSAP